MPQLIISTTRKSHDLCHSLNVGRFQPLFYNIVVIVKVQDCGVNRNPPLALQFHPVGFDVSLTAGARGVMAFSDETILEVARTAEFTDPEAT